MGSSLSGSIVTAVSQGFGGIINPLTTNGMIVAAGPTGKPVAASAYPAWIASYMLNVAVFPLPVSFSNLLSYLFPATVQAYYDRYLEGAFAANQSHLRKWKLGLPICPPCWSRRSSSPSTSSAQPASCSTRSPAPRRSRRSRP